MAIKAIETRYGGYRFRSRLEARWAVFFTTVGLDWDYEPEGVKVDTPIGRLNYLPDFWLPAAGQWVEVKGHLDLESLERQLALAVGMTRCGEGNDIAVLGDVPRPGSAKWPVQLHFHGRLWGVPWSPEPGCPMSRPRVAMKINETFAAHLTDGFPFASGTEWAEEGLEAARCARFEWGESG